MATYSVTNNGTDLNKINALEFDGSCWNKTSAFVMGSKFPPYRVYSGAWPGPEACGSAHGAAPGSGLVDTNTQSWRYLTASGIHGLDFGRIGDTELIYSADLNGDSVWTHAVDGPTGIVKELNRLAVPANSHPRHLAAHPTGNYLYVLMEAANTIVSYSLNSTTGLPIAAPNTTFDLLPPAIRAGLNPALNTTNTTQYWSAEVMVSHDGRYLWATARAGFSAPDNYGYINGFLLGTDGKILKQLFQAPTPIKGGIANAVAPAPKELGSEWAALTDIHGNRTRGTVQMWRMTGRKETELGVEYSGAEVKASVDLTDGGCCANVAWYD